MARRHWLDPLARKVLQAMGDLPLIPRPQRRRRPHHRLSRSCQRARVLVSTASAST